MPHVLGGFCEFPLSEMNLTQLATTENLGPGVLVGVESLHAQVVQRLPAEPHRLSGAALGQRYAC